MNKIDVYDVLRMIDERLDVLLECRKTYPKESHPALKATRLELIHLKKQILEEM